MQLPVAHAAAARQPPHRAAGRHAARQALHQLWRGGHPHGKLWRAAHRHRALLRLRQDGLRPAVGNVQGGQEAVVRLGLGRTPLRTCRHTRSSCRHARSSCRHAHGATLRQQHKLPSHPTPAPRAPVDDHDGLQRRARFERRIFVVGGRLSEALQLGARQHAAPPLHHVCGGGGTVGGGSGEPQ